MVRGTVPINEGMLSVACASERPRASVSTQAKSFDSRTMVENEVRTKRGRGFIDDGNQPRP